MRDQNFRRVLRVDRLLAELGCADILDALAELKERRAALSPASTGQEAVTESMIDAAIAAGPLNNDPIVRTTMKRALAAALAAPAQQVEAEIRDRVLEEAAKAMIHRGWTDSASVIRALKSAHPAQAPQQEAAQARELPPLPPPYRHGGTYESSPFDYHTADQMREYALLARADRSAPEGYVIAPRKATEAMIRAAFGWRQSDKRDGLVGDADMYERIYYAMIAAAPSSPAGEQ